jgi:hypothetical protein
MDTHTKVATVGNWALYVVSVLVIEGLFRALFHALTGHPLYSQVSLVASTLVIVVVLLPLRRRLRDLYRQASQREAGPARRQRGSRAPAQVSNLNSHQQTYSPK